MSFLSEFFSKRMREIREDRGLTQAQAAVLLETDQGNVSRWEGGKYLPTEEALNQIAKGYEINAESFINHAVEKADLILSIVSSLSSLDQEQLRQVKGTITILTDASALASTSQK